MKKVILFCVVLYCTNAFGQFPLSFDPYPTTWGESWSNYPPSSWYTPSKQDFCDLYWAVAERVNATYPFSGKLIDMEDVLARKFGIGESSSGMGKAEYVWKIDESAILTELWDLVFSVLEYYIRNDVDVIDFKNTRQPEYDSREAGLLMPRCFQTPNTGSAHTNEAGYVESELYFTSWFATNSYFCRGYPYYNITDVMEDAGIAGAARYSGTNLFGRVIQQDVATIQTAEERIEPMFHAVYNTDIQTIFWDVDPEDPWGGDWWYETNNAWVYFSSTSTNETDTNRISKTIRYGGFPQSFTTNGVYFYEEGGRNLTAEIKYIAVDTNKIISVLNYYNWNQPKANEMQILNTPVRSIYSAYGLTTRTASIGLPGEINDLVIAIVDAEFSTDGFTSNTAASVVGIYSNIVALGDRFGGGLTLVSTNAGETWTVGSVPTTPVQDWRVTWKEMCDLRQLLGTMTRTMAFDGNTRLLNDFYADVYYVTNRENAGVPPDPYEDENGWEIMGFDINTSGGEWETRPGRTNYNGYMTSYPIPGNMLRPEMTWEAEADYFLNAKARKWWAAYYSLVGGGSGEDCPEEVECPYGYSCSYALNYRITTQFEVEIPICEFTTRYEFDKYSDVDPSDITGFTTRGVFITTAPFTTNYPYKRGSQNIFIDAKECEVGRVNKTLVFPEYGYTSITTSSNNMLVYSNMWHSTINTNFNPPLTNWSYYQTLIGTNEVVTETTNWVNASQMTSNTATARREINYTYWGTDGEYLFRDYTNSILSYFTSFPDEETDYYAHYDYCYGLESTPAWGLDNIFIALGIGCGMYFEHEFKFP